MQALFALVHSPLVGPSTWSLVAERLRQAGSGAVVPVLHDSEGVAVPYWRQHAESAARALATVPADRPLVLVGHSGAGPLLPAIAQAGRRPIAAYLFVDAGLPHGGLSRLDEMAVNDPELAARLRRHLAAGGRFPTWGDADLREVIPDSRLRQGLLAELRPRPLAFFAEPLPQVAGWPDAPCGYLRFSPAYARPAAEAERRGWPYRAFDAGHFHLLVDPAAIADAFSELAQSLLTPAQ